ncbi:hypothetical protein [Tateyamaria sp. SN3-11]|uniref:hypothetical protein n=1 Tax=Tateyamaria sp. SN3-11 TaxID=3092147 RepID=UPI0039ED24BB
MLQEMAGIQEYSENNRRLGEKVAIETYTLDEIYFSTAFVFHEKNERRSLEATFSHLVEHCSNLIKHHHRRDADNSFDALIKCFSWFLPLLAKARVSSAERVIFRKFPGVCYYCAESPHQGDRCKENSGLKPEDRVSLLQGIYSDGWDSRPRTMNGWQAMFQTIYPKGLGTIEYSCVKLTEELGEMAEAIRVFDHSPSYLLSEAADIFSHLFGIASEIQAVAKQINSEKCLNLDLFEQLYPGQCRRCRSTVCICPHLPRETVGRISREIPIIDTEPLFMSFFDILENGRSVARRVRQSRGAEH